MADSRGRTPTGAGRVTRWLRVRWALVVVLSVVVVGWAVPAATTERVAGHPSPVELATDGVEWMELQAMKSGLRAREPKLIDEFLAKRVARAEAEKAGSAQMREWKSIAADFQGLRDVSKFAARAAALERQADVKDAIKAERLDEERELQTTAEVYQLRDRMNNGASFSKLKDRVEQLLEQSHAAEDSSERRIARRVLNGLSASSRSIRNPAFQDLLNRIRPAGQPPPQ